MIADRNAALYFAMLLRTPTSSLEAPQDANRPSSPLIHAIQDRLVGLDHVRNAFIIRLQLTVRCYCGVSFGLCMSGGT